jgi:hypothetical protein
MNATGYRPAIVLALLLGAAASADAHHSWARYDNDAVITLTGVVTRLEWASPHVFVYFDAAGQDQSAVAWTMELDPPVLLRRYGVAREMLEEGARITITGVRARNGAAMMRGLHIVLADGTHVRVSSRV